MDTKETMDPQNPQEYAVNAGVGYEPPPTEELRRPPKPPEERLKSERVEEALRSMPDWELALEGEAITRVKELPTPEVASLYTAYVTGYAGHLGLPLAVSVSGGLVVVTLYAPGCGDAVGGLTESVLDFARQIG